MNDKIDTEIKGVRGEISKLNDKIDSNFKWLLGILIPMWITIILAIILK